MAKKKKRVLSKYSILTTRKKSQNKMENEQTRLRQEKINEKCFQNIHPKKNLNKNGDHKLKIQKKIGRILAVKIF